MTKFTINSKNKLWKLRLKKRVFIPKECIVSATKPDFYKMGCWNNKHDLSFMDCYNLRDIVGNKVDNGIEYRIKLSQVNDGDYLTPNVNLRTHIYDYNKNPQYIRYAEFWNVDRETGTTMYKAHIWYTYTRLMHYCYSEDDLFQYKFVAFDTGTQAAEDRSFYYLPGEPIIKNGNVSTIFFQESLGNGRYITLDWFYNGVWNSNAGYSKACASDYDNNNMWRSIVAKNNEIYLCCTSYHNDAILYINENTVNGVKKNKIEALDINKRTTFNNPTNSIANFMNCTHMNNNNIFVLEKDGYVCFLRLKHTDILKRIVNNSEQTSMFAAPRINHVMNDGRVFNDTVWRSFNLGHVFTSLNRWNSYHLKPRINDNNILINCESSGEFVIMRYNMNIDDIDDVGPIVLDLQCPSNSNIGVSINNNNEVVAVCSNSGIIDIYELEYMNEGKYGYGLGNLNNKNNTNQPMTMISSLINEEDKIEEPFCSEILINTNLDKINIICSPRELNDSELVLLDGSNLAKSAEPYLYNIFGDKYNTEHTPTDYFSLPNLSGRYIVGNKKEENNKYSTSEQALQAFALETEHYFGFSPKENIIKKYYKSKEKESNNITSDINSERIIKNITINTNNRNNRLSTTIDDKCYLFYIKRRL